MNSVIFYKLSSASASQPSSSSAARMPGIASLGCVDPKSPKSVAPIATVSVADHDTRRNFPQCSDWEDCRIKVTNMSSNPSQKDAPYGSRSALAIRLRSEICVETAIMVITANIYRKPGRSRRLLQQQQQQ